ncbi:MAG: DUF4329 domain-containing protein [Pseudomonadota bacterium]
MFRNVPSTPLILGLCALLWVVLVLRAGMSTKEPEDFVTTVSQGEVQTFAREQLAALQQRSFSEDIELCGVIFEDSDGALGSTTILPGDRASCDIRFFDEPGMAPVASFHTHGAYGPEFDSEVPSLLDLQSDIASRMDGYVSTPGGRFWRVDWQSEEVVQICGEGCLPQDPTYRPCAGDRVVGQFSIHELEKRARGDLGSC